MGSEFEEWLCDAWFESWALGPTDRNRFGRILGLRFRNIMLFLWSMNNLEIPFSLSLYICSNFLFQFLWEKNTPPPKKKCMRFLYFFVLSAFLCSLLTLLFFLCRIVTNYKNKLPSKSEIPMLASFVYAISFRFWVFFS